MEDSSVKAGGRFRWQPLFLGTASSSAGRRLSSSFRRISAVMRLQHSWELFGNEGSAFSRPHGMDSIPGGVNLRILISNLGQRFFEGV